MKSPDPRPLGVRTVRKTLADGTVKEYTYTRAPKAREPREPATDSLGSLIAAFERGPEFRALAPRSQDLRIRYLTLPPSVLGTRVGDFRRRDILALRDGIAASRGPGAANNFTSTISALFGWAVDRGWLEFSPAQRLKGLPGGKYQTWTERDLAAALAGFEERARRAVVLAIYTVQRRGDLCAMRWGDIAGGLIRLTQEKTGRRLALPIHPDLAREMARWRADASTEFVLEEAAGRSWHRDRLTMHIVAERDRVGLSDRLNLHGLRRLGAVRLADIGCSAHEIASWTGHKTLREVEEYTSEADQERLAGGALRRLTGGKMSTAKIRKTNV